MKNKNCTIYIARHGQTEWNVKGKVQGHTDSPLTKEGISQAKNLAIELKNIKFDAIYSSDLLRAQRTAEFVALEHRLIVKTKEALRERNFGSLEGQGKDCLILLEQLRKQKIPYETKNIESDEKMIERVILFLRELAIAYPGKTVLVVSHGGILRTLLFHLGFATYEEINKLSIGNTAYIKIDSDGVDFYVKEMKRIDTQVNGNE
jgi:broad specificity phosphatase PhoE